MKATRMLLPALMAGATFFATDTFAQEESLGETNQILACFYECKDGPRPDDWVEVTSLLLINAANRPMTATVALLDGNENMIAWFDDDLSPGDLDEVNICRTLQASGIAPPPAGMIEVVIEDPNGIGGTYGWVKNVVGKFFKVVNEPLDGRVTGVGKTECRVVPGSVITGAEVRADIQAQSPPQIPPILIEQTDP
jgi:hypothetical protein